MNYNKENPLHSQQGSEYNRSSSESQEIARNIETYLRDNKLFYGMAPRENGDASWYISLQNHLVNPEQAENLLITFPQLIHDFHAGSGNLMNVALSQNQTDNLAARRLKKYLTAGVPEGTQEMWEQFIGKGINQVFSTRPDMIIDPSGHFHIVEYNTDGGADRGNTQGVNDYSREILGSETLGVNLARAFVNEIRERFPDKQRVVVATILPDFYRQEYDAQNRYFSRRADEYGNSLGIDWITAKLSDLSIDGEKVQATLHGRTFTVDIVDREFKLPGFTSNTSYVGETELLKAVIEGKAAMMGSILPFQDKLLLGTLFDDQFSTAYPESSLSALRTLHVETEIVDGDKPQVRFGDEIYTWDDIYNLRPDFHMVLKRGGDTIGSTGSKGLSISNDTNIETWKRDLDTALAEPLRGGNYWVLQRFYQSDKFPVHFIKNSRSQPKTLNVINRFSPYYVRRKDGLQLGNVLVTAGTDEETYKRARNNIHGLRQNTYQAVSIHTR